MTNTELKELIHLLMMCGIMDKPALESGNISDEEWLRMQSLIDKYRADNTELEVQGDLISREALLKAMEDERQYLLARGLLGAEHILVHHCLPLIDNAPTVDAIPNEEGYEMYNKGYMSGYERGKKERLQDVWIPVSERLPEESLNSVLGWDTYRERCVFVQYIDGHFQITGNDESFDIVAWQPVPEPYQKGGEEE